MLSVVSETLVGELLGTWNTFETLFLNVKVCVYGQNQSYSCSMEILTATEVLTSSHIIRKGI